MDEGNPLILCMNQHKSWAEPQAEPIWKTPQEGEQSFGYWHHVNHCPYPRLTPAPGRPKPHSKALKVKLIRITPCSR